MQMLREFQEWRNADPANAAAYDRVQRSMQLSNAWVQDERAGKGRLTRVPFYQRRSFLVSAMAACLIGAAGLGFYWSGERGGLRGGVSQSVLADALYVTRVGERREFKLPDGSRIYLDADSQVRVSYTAGVRNVHLDHGRARFTVAHEASRPFAVVAGDGRVIAHGTIFIVAVSSHGVHVSLEHGSIEVTGQPQLGVKQALASRYLKPGEQLNFRTAYALPAPKAVDPGELSWVSGRLSFLDAHLGDAVEEINRYNTVKILIDDPKLTELRVSGGYDAQAPEAFARAVAKALGLKFVVRPDGNILLQSGPV